MVPPPAPEPDPDTPHPQVKKEKKASDKRVTGVAQWNAVETWVCPTFYLTLAHPSPRSLARVRPHPPLARTQAATESYAGANERHSLSTEEYRKSVADTEYPAHLIKICGPEGKGGDGLLEFPVKKRLSTQGGGLGVRGV